MWLSFSQPLYYNVVQETSTCTVSLLSYTWQQVRLTQNTTLFTQNIIIILRNHTKTKHTVCALVSSPYPTCPRSSKVESGDETSYACAHKSHDNLWSRVHGSAMGTRLAMHMHTNHMTNTRHYHHKPHAEFYFVMFTTRHPYNIVAAVHKVKGHFKHK